MENEALATDLLNGVAAIAEYTGWSARRVYHEAERGRLPLFKSRRANLARKKIDPAPAHSQAGSQARGRQCVIAATSKAQTIPSWRCCYRRVTTWTQRMFSASCIAL